MIILSIVIGLFLPWENKVLRVGLKLLLLPLSVGLGFEFIMLAGKHPNAFTRALSAPGLWVQRLTTKEPDAKQIECAIAALKAALPEEFPQEEQKESEKTEVPENKKEESADTAVEDC